MLSTDASVQTEIHEDVIKNDTHEYVAKLALAPLPSDVWFPVTCKNVAPGLSIKVSADFLSSCSPPVPILAGALGSVVTKGTALAVIDFNGSLLHVKQGLYRHLLRQESPS